MNTYLSLTPHDPIVARDGRPFGEGQGNRMHGMAWPLPSVVAGSFRTALVKGTSSLDFTGDMPNKLMQLAVAGVFPMHKDELYLPAPIDAVAQPSHDKRNIQCLHRAIPQSLMGGCDFPINCLKPVMISDEQLEHGQDFKPANVPAWWPITKYSEWLQGKNIRYDSTFLDSSFLETAHQHTRDHVCLDADRGVAAESLIFATSGLHLTHLQRFGVDANESFHKRFAELTLSVRVANSDDKSGVAIDKQFNLWHPLGGERRMVHWITALNSKAWDCPTALREILKTTTRVRMILTTPAIFKSGWKPGWINDDLTGELHGVKLKLVGVNNGRWRAVSGWSLAPPRGPKPIRRMVPAGSVYFFDVPRPGDAASLADRWLQSVSDDEQAQRDGFGLAVWGNW